ncbi:MAG: hypothetical protein IPO63_13565 [Bacteroidetes bacterium]|nr:hypothetical protein [Bacteroidota bacterium]
MNKKANQGRRGPQMRQRVTQKHTMRNVVIASSILGCMAIALVVVNLSSNETSYANNKNAASEINYRTVDTYLNQRMLIDPSNSSSLKAPDYKGKEGSQTVKMASRAEDLIVTNINQISSE